MSIERKPRNPERDFMISVLSGQWVQANVFSFSVPLWWSWKQMRKKVKETRFNSAFRFGQAVRAVGPVFVGKAQEVWEAQNNISIFRENGY